MDEVWPRVAAARPAARALIVGRNPPAALPAEAARRGLPWRFTGFVDDIRPHVRAGDVSVIPLRVGSGTRLKAFEAMALGRPVVSTGLGVEGLGVTAETHYLRGRHGRRIRRRDSAPARPMRRCAGVSPRRRAGCWRRISPGERVARQFEAICLRHAGAGGRGTDGAGAGGAMTLSAVATLLLVPPVNLLLLALAGLLLSRGTGRGASCAAWGWPGCCCSPCRSPATC